MKSRSVVFFWHTYKRIHGICLWQSVIRTTLQTNNKTIAEVTRWYWLFRSRLKLRRNSFILKILFNHCKGIFFFFELWTIKFMFFFRCSCNPLSCFFFKFLLLMFIFILHLVFIVYFCLLDGFLPCPAFFLVSLPFFFLVLLHSLSFFNKLFSICSWF